MTAILIMAVRVKQFSERIIVNREVWDVIIIISLAKRAQQKLTSQKNFELIHKKRMLTIYLNDAMIHR